MWLSSLFLLILLSIGDVTISVSEYCFGEKSILKQFFSVQKNLCSPHLATIQMMDKVGSEICVVESGYVYRFPQANLQPDHLLIDRIVPGVHWNTLLPKYAGKLFSGKDLKSLSWLNDGWWQVDFQDKSVYLLNESIVRKSEIEIHSVGSSSTTLYIFTRLNQTVVVADGRQFSGKNRRKSSRIISNYLHS